MDLNRHCTTYYDYEKKLGLVKSFDAYEPCLVANKLVIKLTEKVILEIEKNKNAFSKTKKQLTHFFV